MPASNSALSAAMDVSNIGGRTFCRRPAEGQSEAPEDKPMSHRQSLHSALRAAMLAAFAVSLPWVRGQASAPVEYSTVQVIGVDDSPAVVVEKAAKVLPRPNQSAWMRLERTFFIHFSVNTFDGAEWGSGRENPSIFSPTSLDANQWVSAVKNAGGKLLILVSKHHDGFCLWPSRYTSHSVASSPWLNGKGDLVGAVAAAVHAHGIKLGIYLSPADLYQLRTNPKNPAGCYGNGSPKIRSVIPTDVASFQSDPAQGRAPPAGFTSYTYEVDDYNRYFLNQLYELLTEYGPISDVWFDGANPDPSVHETYDYAAWYDLIRHLQPEAVISVKGPDVRWVGNEGGVGRTTEWSVIPLSQPPERFTWPDMQAADLGSRAKLAPGSYLWWYPAEVNTPILNGWFWSADKRPKGPAELVDYFYRSVGRNGNMLLNLSPDTRGLIPDDQLASLNKMAQVIDGTFANDLAAGAKFAADNSNPANSPSLAHDGNLDTWWEAAPGHTSATFTMTLPSAVTFDVVSLQEAVDHRSQRIESFVVETWSGSTWTAPPTVDEQTTVGHKRLVRLTRPVTTDRVRIRITASRLEPTLAEIGLFKQFLPGAAKVPALPSSPPPMRLTRMRGPSGGSLPPPARLRVLVLRSIWAACTGSAASLNVVATVAAALQLAASAETAPGANILPQADRQAPAGTGDHSTAQ
jgi:alpha-L-fucosidase